MGAVGSFSLTWSSSVLEEPVHVVVVWPVVVELVRSSVESLVPVFHCLRKSRFPM
jgi:hypothetical protein